MIFGNLFLILNNVNAKEFEEKNLCSFDIEVRIYTPYKTNANISFELLILYDLYLRNKKLYPNIV
jgi:hypothetical protein